MEALLQLKGIDKAFPGVKALSGAALNVYPGRVMALVGENGAGKSTMMKVLTGIYTRDAGTLLWLGKETTFTGPKSSQEAGIGIIHQELNLIPQLTIAENIFLGREFVNRFGKIDWKTMYAEADKLLAKLNLRFKSDKLVGDLSIGDQQMVEIAKVLSFESKVIIMDEPTDALTDTETESLFRVIRELKSQGRGIVYISHRMKEIFEICDDVTVFRDGQFIAEREVASLTEDSLIEMMVGRKLEDQYPHLDKAPGDIRLKVDNLCGPGVNDVSFTLRKGEILGVSGLMGAGRTELMKVLYGALPRTSGYVTLDGHEVVTRSPQDGLANGIVYISEDRKRDGLVLGMSVKENMSLTALRYFSDSGKRVLKPELLTEIAGERSARFDNKGDRFYDLISALHKSVRGSAPDAALYWYARIITAGGDPLYVARRCLAIASEDVGNADPRAMQVAIAAWDCFTRVGPAEGERAIAQAIVYLACAPKSNAVYTAFKAALADARERPDYDVPVHLRNAPTKLMKEMGYGQEYRYAHDEANAYAAGEVYFPPEIAQTRYYFPTNRGLEGKIGEKLAWLAEQDQNSPIKRYR